MRESDWDTVVEAAAAHAREHLASLPDRRVHSGATVDDARAALSAPLTDDGEPAADVVADLAATLGPMTTAYASGRFYGYVIGGLHPAALGAEWLVAAWDQNSGLASTNPGIAALEEATAAWLVDLLGLPSEASTGFVTGGQMANLTCLAAARGHVLRAVGWDVEADGLLGAPGVHVVAKASRHSTIGRALRYLGLGERRVVEVGVDDQDRVDVAALAAALEGLSGPTIVCVEAGNLNTGAFDPFDAVADTAEAHRGRGHPTWVHVDGAIGLWAAASREHAGLTAGLARSDSWSTDAHKLLNTAYDSGIALTRHPADHHAATSVRAAYLATSEGAARDPMDWTPELSRRARAVGVHAVLRSLGRQGVEAVVDRAAAMARRLAGALAVSGAAEIANDVVFNQALVRWRAPAGADPDSYCDAVIAAIQADGTCFVSGTTWRGRRMMRVSVSDWATDEDDVDRAAGAMLRCAAEVAARG